MRNINSKILIFSLLTTLFIVSGCLVDEQWDIKNGGQYAANMYPETDVAFLYEVTTEVTVNLDPFANEGVTISAINVTKQLFTENGDSDPVVIDVSGDQFTQTSAELFADVPVNGNVLTEDDLSPGDYWTLSYNMTLSDSRVLTIGDETTILFSCPSDLAGSYDAVGSGVAGAGWGNFPGNPDFPWDGTEVVTLTELSSGVYEMNHIAGGFYPNFWGGEAELGTLRDVCGSYTIDSKTDQWADTITCTVTNNGDGTITVVWSNTYGDGGTYTLTPQ